MKKGMFDMKNKLAQLLSVKSLVTLMFVGTYCWMALNGIFDISSLQNIVMIVVSFYFGTVYEKKGVEK